MVVGALFSRKIFRNLFCQRLKITNLLFVFLPFSVFAQEKIDLRWKVDAKEEVRYAFVRNIKAIDATDYDVFELKDNPGKQRSAIDQLKEMLVPTHYQELTLAKINNDTIRA